MVALCWRDMWNILALSTDVGDSMTKVSQLVGADSIQLDIWLLLKNTIPLWEGLSLLTSICTTYISWQLFDQAILNALVIYRRNHKYSLQKIMSHKDFQLEIVHQLCAGALLTPRMVGHSPSQSLSHLQCKHFLYRAEKRTRYVMCGCKKFLSWSKKRKDTKVKTKCSKCNVNLLNQVHAAFSRARLVSWNCFGPRVGMRVYVSTPEAINNQWHDMVWYRLCAIG